MKATPQKQGRAAILLTCGDCGGMTMLNPGKILGPWEHFKFESRGKWATRTIFGYPPSMREGEAGLRFLLRLCSTRKTTGSESESAKITKPKLKSSSDT